MPGYDWRTSGESAGGTSYPVSRPSHHAPSQPSGGAPDYGPPSIQNPPPPPPVQTTGTWEQGDPNDEKGDYIDYDYVNPNTGLTVGQTQSAATAAAKKKEEARMLQMQEAQGLASALGHIDKEQLQNYMESGVLPAEIAVKNPELAKFSGYDSAGNPIYVDPKTGKAYDPRGKLTAGMSEDLSDLQFMQDEGVYGGVSGLEAEVNKQKGAVVNEIEKWKSQGLNDNQINERLKKDKNFQSLTTLFGGDTETAIQNLKGYDPTGVHTWSEIESDPVLYEKYLNRGENWDDPLSGILKAPGEVHQGEPGGGRRYGRRYGGGQRERNLALLQFLRGGLPTKKRESTQPFFDKLKPQYDPEEARLALDKGLFSKIIPGGAFNPEAMKRLVTSWGSGYTNPRYANVAARGGIMSAWNNMRR